MCCNGTKKYIQLVEKNHINTSLESGGYYERGNQIAEKKELDHDSGKANSQSAKRPHTD
jgi:hypothetical protein